MSGTQTKRLYHAHVQHPKGSGYMMQSGDFENAEQAVERYLALVDADRNLFGRNALLRNPEPLVVTLIPAELHGPDVMSYMGFCSIWDENGDDMYETEQPETVFSIPNRRFEG